MIIREFIIQAWKRNIWEQVMSYQDEKEAEEYFLDLKSIYPDCKLRLLYRETSIFEEEIA